MGHIPVVQLGFVPVVGHRVQKHKVYAAFFKFAKTASKHRGTDTGATFPGLHVDASEPCHVAYGFVAYPFRGLVPTGLGENLSDKKRRAKQDVSCAAFPGGYFQLVTVFRDGDLRGDHRSYRLLAYALSERIADLST